MYIPKLHAFASDKAEVMLSEANKLLVARRKTMESPPEDGMPTDEQYDEIRHLVAQNLLTEFRASIEMDAFELVDGYTAINGDPSSAEEISSFWSEIQPKIVKPILEEVSRLQDGHSNFNLSEFEPWNETGMRAFCIALAGKLRSAVLEVDNTTFAHVTEIDQSRIALLGTTEWVEAGESATTTTGAKKPPAPPAPPPPPTTLDSHASEPPKRGRPSNKENAAIQNQDLVSSIWVNLGQIMNWEVNKFCHLLSISSPTLRNYSGGKKSKLTAEQADIMEKELKDRADIIANTRKLLASFKANPAAASEA